MPFLLEEAFLPWGFCGHPQMARHNPEAQGRGHGSEVSELRLSALGHWPWGKERPKPAQRVMPQGPDAELPKGVDSSGFGRHLFMCRRTPHTALC